MSAISNIQTSFKNFFFDQVEVKPSLESLTCSMEKKGSLSAGYQMSIAHTEDGLFEVTVQSKNKEKKFCLSEDELRQVQEGTGVDAIVEARLTKEQKKAVGELAKQIIATKTDLEAQVQIVNKLSLRGKAVIAIAAACVVGGTSYSLYRFLGKVAGTAKA